MNQLQLIWSIFTVKIWLHGDNITNFLKSSVMVKTFQ